MAPNQRAATSVDRRTVLKTLGGASTLGLAGCLGGGSGGGGGDDTVRAAWLYISEVGDLGWSWAHDQGRKAVAEKFDWLETASSEAVAPADSERVIREYTNNGYDVVFGTTFEYMDPMLSVAEDNPDTKYEHCSGYKTAENMGRYFGRMYQARFLTGMAAGMLTEADSLGYVGAFPTPEVVRGINAFAHGAASANDGVTTEVRWVNSWYDPPKEREAAQSLIDAGVDVMAQHQDSPAAVKAAAEADIWATGYDAPMGKFAEGNYITSPVWEWEVFYEPTLKAIRDGEWTADAYWKGLSADVVDLDEWGSEVPGDVKSAVSEKRTAIEKGEFDVWAGTAFEGKDDAFLFGEMNSFVESVDGSVPDN